MIDIGANLTNKVFRDDLPEVLDRAWSAGLTHIVITGTTLSGSQQAAALAATDDRLSYTAGVHPHHAKGWDEATAAGIRTLLTEAVAVGETGLDYFRDNSPRPDQRRAFEAQLALAAETGQPLFLHQRDAADDFFAILGEWRDRIGPAVAHCFTDPPEILTRCLDLDLHVGVTGWVCDERRGQALRDSVRLIPAERLMIETDAPYLLPRDLEPRPASRRNEPVHLGHVLQRVAQERGEDAAKLGPRIEETTRKFFGLLAPEGAESGA